MEIWYAKPHEVVKASTPEELGHKDVDVYPFSLAKLWGSNAPAAYCNARGFTFVPTSKWVHPPTELPWLTERKENIRLRACNLSQSLTHNLLTDQDVSVIK